MKKINFGVILIVITVSLLSVYIIYQGNMKSEIKEDVTNIIKEYLTTHNEYFMLEKEYRDINKNISNDEYNKYLEKIKNNISGYVVEDRVDYVFEQYKQYLDTQLNGKYILKDCSKEFLNIIDFNYDGRYVFVRFNQIIKVDKDNRFLDIKNEKTGRYEGRITSSIFSQEMQEIIVFEKIDNTYKVVHDAAIMLSPESIANDSTNMFF